MDYSDSDGDREKQSNMRYFRVKVVRYSSRLDRERKERAGVKNWL